MTTSRTARPAREKAPKRKPSVVKRKTIAGVVHSGGKPRKPKKPALLKTGANGRPSAYLPEYAQEALELCMVGFTDKMLATYFEVSENTIGNWKKQRPEFLGSLRRGRALADGKVARALYERAIGFEVKKDVVIGKGDDAQILTLFEKLPPDVQAARFWLKNRQKDLWKENVLDDVDGGAGLFQINIMERERTAEEKAALLAQRQQAQLG